MSKGRFYRREGRFIPHGLAIAGKTAIMPGSNLLREYHVPNSESAKKRVRQNIKRRALNNWRKHRVKSQIKSFLGAVQEKDTPAAETEFRKVCSVLDKVASTSTMHKNTASRRKSRLARRLNEMKSAGA